MKNWVELNVIADEIADKIKSKVNQNKKTWFSIVSEIVDKTSENMNKLEGNLYWSIINDSNLMYGDIYDPPFYDLNKMRDIADDRCNILVEYYINNYIDINYDDVELLMLNNIMNFTAMVDTLRDSINLLKQLNDKHGIERDPIAIYGYTRDYYAALSRLQSCIDYLRLRGGDYTIIKSYVDLDVKKMIEYNISKGHILKIITRR